MPPSNYRLLVKRCLARAANAIRPDLMERLEIGKFAQQHVAPPPVEGVGEPLYAQGERLDLPGIDFDLESQTALIRALAEFSGLFEAIRRDQRINPRFHSVGDKVRNGYFPTPDAETYAAMVARLAPPMIYEIGGGFSTLIARKVIDDLSLNTCLTVVDPEPRTDVRSAADELVLERIEESPVDLGEIGSGSILFVDSSHIVRSGGDVADLYCRVIPALQPGVVVHVHDIFLPFDYSPFSRRAWWTEQYMLQTLLGHSPRYRVDLALRWLTHAAPDLMRNVYGDAVVDEPAHGGGSFWFSIAS